jgi:Flp pilus assembly protein TadD
MLAKSVLMVLLAGVLLPAGGCANRRTVTADDGEYRTVRIEPGRDTDAARRADARGLEALDRGDLDEAEEHFKAALQADVTYGPAHNNLGKVHFQREDWYAAAVEFDNAIKLLPRHAEPRNNLGLVYDRDAQHDKAVNYFRQAVGIDPDNVEYRANLVRSLIKRGERTAEVAGLLRYVIEHDARADWVVWAGQQLAQVEGRAGRR